MHINLLPPYVQARIRARALLRRCCVLWLVAGVGIIACSSAQFWELRAAQARLQRLSVHCQPLRLMENAIESEQEQLTHLQAEVRRLENLQPNNRHVAALGILIRAAQPEQGKLQVQKLNWHAGTPGVTPLASAGTAPTQSATPASSAALNSSLFLQGVVDDESVLARFVAALHCAGVFQRVDLKSSSHIPDGTGFARQFQIECNYEDRP